MAQEEYILGRCHSGGGSGGGCRPKKAKQKKAPQRGLGVAQLEKIISEEKQKKGYFGKNNIDSDKNTHHAPPPPPPRASPFLAVHPNFRPNTADVVIQENWPYKSWNASEYNNHHVNCTSPSVIAYDPQLNLAYDHSNAQILAHQFQRPPSSSLVKSNSGISTVMMMSTQNQMEPPSIPSFHSTKNYAEEKMIGMMKKRPYPFSVDHSHPSKPDELASFTTTNDQQQYTLHMEPRYKLIRESVPNPGPPERNLNEAPTESERIHGNFLTLAPPAAAPPPLAPVQKQTLDYLGHPRPEFYENDYRPTHQEYGQKRQLIERAGPSGSVEKSFSFFPIELRSGEGKRGETIDLNLKL